MGLLSYKGLVAAHPLHKEASTSTSLFDLLGELGTYTKGVPIFAPIVAAYSAPEGREYDRFINALQYGAALSMPTYLISKKMGARGLPAIAASSFAGSLGALGGVRVSKEEDPALTRLYGLMRL